MLSYDFYKSQLTESVQNVRYSVEVNYSTSQNDVLDGFVKICLGYVSACLKKMDFHTKLIFSKKPFRIIVASRNWDDGEWVALVSWNEKHKTFMVSRGFYNKLDKTVSIQKTAKMPETYSAKDLAKYVHILMMELKDKKDRFIPDKRKVHIRKS